LLFLSYISEKAIEKAMEKNISKDALKQFRATQIL
jgi:hypothetical protein